MPTWYEIRNRLRSKYQLQHDDPAWVGVGFAFPMNGKQVQQTVRIEEHKIGPIPGIRIGCEVIAANRVPPHKALERNFAFPIGALAIFQDSYVIICALPLEGLQWNALDLIMQNLAKDAAALRESAPPAAS
jgi:hypothetical protein